MSELRIRMIDPVSRCELIVEVTSVLNVNAIIDHRIVETLIDSLDVTDFGVNVGA